MNYSVKDIKRLLIAAKRNGVTRLRVGEHLHIDFAQTELPEQVDVDVNPNGPLPAMNDAIFRKGFPPAPAYEKTAPSAQLREDPEWIPDSAPGALDEPLPPASPDKEQSLTAEQREEARKRIAQVRDEHDAWFNDPPPKAPPVVMSDNEG